MKPKEPTDEEYVKRQEERVESRREVGEMDLTIGPKGRHIPEYDIPRNMTIEYDVQRNMTIEDEFRQAPPIVQAAVLALLRFQQHIDEMGYDISYYQEDLPKIVTDAIAPWKIRSLGYDPSPDMGMDVVSKGRRITLPPPEAENVTKE